MTIGFSMEIFITKETKEGSTKMNARTRQKALRALLTARNAGGDDYLFPRVFVCGTHVFFTFMAAYRQQKEYLFLDGIEVPIEKVETPSTTAVNKEENQRGDLIHGEVFPSRLYAQVMHS